MALVPNDGSTVGNVRLRARLGWNDEHYYAVRDALLDEGVLLKGVGYGGTVRRAAQEPEPRVLDPREIESRRESNLYAPLAQILATEWARDRRLETFHVEMTADQGRRATGGRWTRPDLTMLSMRTFVHLPGKFLDVWTFEVKPAGMCDVTGVYEAAAHSRCATRSYVMFHVPNHRTEDENLARCVDEARRFGVGLIAFGEAGNFATWDVRAHAIRREPDPDLLDEFLATQMSDVAKGKLARWKA